MRVKYNPAQNNEQSGQPARSRTCRLSWIDATPIPRNDGRRGGRYLELFSCKRDDSGERSFGRHVNPV